MKPNFFSLRGEPATFEVTNNVDFVRRANLCHGCGTCEAICPEDAVGMKFDARQGIYLPRVSDACIDCGLCVHVCPGFELDLHSHQRVVPPPTQHRLVGPHFSVRKVFSTDAATRSAAASGGAVTEIASHLLRTGRVDSVILVRMGPADPTMAEAFVTETPEGLRTAQKSMYCPVPLNVILKQVLEGPEGARFAFIGLPHHVHGLRLLQRIRPKLNDSVPYVISLFTAHVPSQRATGFILYKQGVASRDVAKIEYRGGGNPGRMLIVLKDGTERTVPHLHWTYSGHSVPHFFYPVREWLYFDKLSEWADFSCGDNWMGGLAEQRGVSTVVTRSPHAELVIEEMAACGAIESTAMTAEQLVRDQGLVLKLDVSDRIELWRRLRQPVPLYTRQFLRARTQPLRTARFAAGIVLGQYKVPFWLMNIIIGADYYLRALPIRMIKKYWNLAGRGLAVLGREDTPAPRARIPKVVLIGGYGYKDIGDEAMPHALRLHLRRSLGRDLEIVMLSPDPKSTAQSHGERSNHDFTFISHARSASTSRKIISLVLTGLLLATTVAERMGLARRRLWPSARAALDEIGTCDALLNVGGGNLNSVIPQELYKKCTTYLVASILGKPVFLSGQTIGPLDRWTDRIYARFCLNRVRAISFRDRAVSLQRMRDLGVRKPEMFDAADDSMGLEGIPRQEAISMLQQETGLEESQLFGRPLVFANLKASLTLFKGGQAGDLLEAETALMAGLADRLIDEYECRVIFCGTDFSKGVDDRILHSKIHSLMRQQGSAYCLQGEYSDLQLIGLIGCADLVFGARYHFNVFAALQGVPFLGLASGSYQRTKLKGLAELLDLPRCYFDAEMESATTESVWQQLKPLMEKRKDIARKIAGRTPALKRASTAVVDRVVAELRARVGDSANQEDSL